MGGRWYIRMDKIYADNGCKREDYHKRKFSGKPLKEIKKQAQKIFDEARDMLKDFKDPDVDKSEIVKLCDDMVELLTRPHIHFQILHKRNPTQADVKIVRTCAKKYIEKWRDIIEDHAVEQFERHLENGLWLVIEQFVASRR